MSQNLTKLIRGDGFSWNPVLHLKTKRGVRTEAVKRAWRTRKRQAATKKAS